MKIQTTIATIAALLLALPAAAQQATLEGRAPRVVQVGERFQLVYTANERTQHPQINIPQQAFRILSGPGTSTSSRTEIVNGQISSSLSISYTYMLEALAEGKHTIAPATIVAKGGKTVSSNSITIEVMPAGQPQPQTGQGQQRQQNQAAGHEGGSDFFVRVQVDRRKVYQGEPIMATLKLYTTLNLSGFDKIDLPKFTGFYKEEIETAGQVQLDRENVDGRIYQSGVIAKYLLIPQRSGTIEIDPLTVDAIVAERVRTNDPFDAFFGGNVRRYRVGNSSPRVKIEVMPLPEPKPADFTGGVGKIKLAATLSHKQLKVNDAVNLKLKFSGTGNIRFLDNPRLSFPPDFDTYDPKKEVNVKASAGGVSGSVSWDFLAIPRHAGRHTVPRQTFSYFDPAAKAYRQLTAGPFEIEVLPGEGGETAAGPGAAPAAAKQGVRDIGSDIRFIQSGDLALKPRGQYIYGTAAFWAGYLLPAALLAIYLLARRKQAQDLADAARTRNRRAAKVSANRLKAARRHVRDNKEGEAYDEILRALWQYLADKLGVDQARLSRDTVADELRRRDLPADLMDQVVALADTCEMARYAPAAAQRPAAEALAQAADLLAKLERAIK